MVSFLSLKNFFTFVVKHPGAPAVNFLPRPGAGLTEKK
jgi:hypothetical protein